MLRLAASIRSRGLLDPLIVVEEDHERWTVVSGNRRLACIRTHLLEVMPCVPARIIELEQADRLHAARFDLLNRIHYFSASPHKLDEAVRGLLALGVSPRELATDLQDFSRIPAMSAAIRDLRLRVCLDDSAPADETEGTSTARMEGACGEATLHVQRSKEE
jgi:hypothetical protein